MFRSVKVFHQGKTVGKTSLKDLKGNREEEGENLYSYTIYQPMDP